MTNTSPRSLVLLCYVLLVVFAATSVSAFAIPAASSALSVRTLVHSFLGLHHDQGVGATAARRRGAETFSEEYGELKRRGQATVTELYVLQTTVTTKTITTDTAVRKTTTVWRTTVSYPSNASTTPNVPIITYYTTATVTSPFTGRRRRRRDVAERQDVGFVDFGPDMDWITTRTVLASTRVTATKTVYSTTFTFTAATATRNITVFPKTPAANASGSGLWTQITWVYTTVTTAYPEAYNPMRSATSRPTGIKGSVKGAVAGSVVGAVAVVAGLIGFCIFRRKRSTRKFDERSSRRSQSMLSDTGYKSVPGAPSSGSESGPRQEQPPSSSQQRGEPRIPESEGLMAGADAAPQTPGHHYHFGEGGGAEPSGVGAYGRSPLQPPNRIPGTPVVIPPSSTTSLRTDPSPRNSGNSAADSGVGIGITFPTTGRHHYAHLSPLNAASSEYRSPLSRRRAESLSSNIAPPPLQEYQASREVSELPTTGQLLTSERSTGTSSFHPETETRAGSGRAGSATMGGGRHGEWGVRRKPAPV